jgi:hypothetical protein
MNIISASVFLFASMPPVLLNAAETNVPPPDPKLFAEVRKLLREAPLIDGHNDVPWEYRKFSNDFSAVDLRHDTSQLKSPWATDIPRHVTDETMRAAIKASKAPVIFPHSSAAALCHHPRNVPDDVLRMVATNGGVVMVCFVPGYLTESDRVDFVAGEAEKERLQKLKKVAGRNLLRAMRGAKRIAAAMQRAASRN